MTTASLLISTYNWPQALEKVLWALSVQSRQDFEIILADDGSGPDTAALIARMAPAMPVPVVHVWQPDLGFAKCRILNKALALARGERIIVTDGDCVVRRDFVDCHIRQARPGQYLSGSYFKLPPHVSRAISRAGVETQQVFSPRWLVAHGMRPGPRLYAKTAASPLLGRLLDRVVTARPTWNGHSASCLRRDALAVNGFNEAMGYGGEDAEFGARLTHSGLRGRRIRFSTVALHLHHGRSYATPEMRANSSAIKRRTRAEGLIRAERGVDQWLGPDGAARLDPQDRVARFDP
ncbi:glycosyltransferase family 2 protein [uncultured Paracoccus sp.]|uniref:glycosyltransferase family 2 protein n=1 Tax=uncultured Paracoccus sp. TaxID=189685 RepID=UPI00262C0175|nr:glycosyltransferase family 2 protein [uncultured Paracoccus sp.]